MKAYYLNIPQKLGKSANQKQNLNYLPKTNHYPQRSSLQHLILQIRQDKLEKRPI